MTNVNRTTIYIGVTSDLIFRIQEHKLKLHPYSFTARYNLTLIIYYETFTRIEEAINREKEIKKWRREKKETLINSQNPQWKDL
jgi:putative endonuclease